MTTRPFRSLFRGLPAEPLVLAVIGLMAGGLLAFAGLAESVADGRAHGFDLSVLQALRVAGAPGVPIGPKWLASAAMDLTSLGSSWVLALFTFIAIGFAFARGRPRLALTIAAAIGGASLISNILKAAFDRSRPDLIYRAISATTPSFPSGHAMLSAAFYLTLGALFAQVLPTSRARAYVLVAAAGLTLLIGITRIYLGVHWLSDVLAGWALGSAWAMACWLAARLWRRRPDQGLAD